MPRGRPITDSNQRSRAKVLQQTLDDRRETLGYGMERLAHESLVNRRTLDKYFEGDSPNPSFFLIAALARVLELSLDELVEVQAHD